MIKKNKKLCMLLALMGIYGSSLADTGAKFKMGYQGVIGSYSSSSAKESIGSNGFILNLTFLDDITVTHTSTDTKIKFKDAASNIDQTSKFTTLGYNFYTDGYGVVNVRTDYQSINNNDPTGATDGVSINSYQASVLPYDESYYAEVGLSKSNYPFAGNSTYTTPLTVNQLNASYGTSLTASDWLTLKFYQISSSDKARTHDKKNYNSIEAKYKYFLPENLAKIDNLEVSTLVGKRIFAVDGAAGSAYNMGDLQTGSLGVTAEWKVTEDSNILFSISRENYRPSTGDDYNGSYSYINYNYDF